MCNLQLARRSGRNRALRQRGPSARSKGNQPTRSRAPQYEFPVERRDWQIAVMITESLAIPRWSRVGQRSIREHAPVVGAFHRKPSESDQSRCGSTISGPIVDRLVRTDSYVVSQETVTAPRVSCTPIHPSVRSATAAPTGALFPLVSRETLMPTTGTRPRGTQSLHPTTPLRTDQLTLHGKHRLAGLQELLTRDFVPRTETHGIQVGDDVAGLGGGQVPRETYLPATTPRSTTPKESFMRTQGSDGSSTGGSSCPVAVPIGVPRHFLAIHGKHAVGAMAPGALARRIWRQRHVQLLKQVVARGPIHSLLRHHPESRSRRPEVRRMMRKWRPQRPTRKILLSLSTSFSTSVDNRCSAS